MSKIKMLILDRLDYLRFAVIRKLLPKGYFIGYCDSKKNENLWRSISRENICLNAYRNVLRIMEKGYGTDWRDDMYNYVQKAIQVHAENITELSKKFEHNDNDSSDSD